jgi:hypothetical protein
MRIKAFQLEEPLPELYEPHVVAMLEPWIDAGNVGSMTLSWLEDETDAYPLGELTRPGSFYDLTRYRPMTYFDMEQRRLRFPNTRISFSHREEGPDFIFIRLLEPHMLGEYFVESVLRVMQTFEVQRFTLIGSMYNFVPHTRPPLVSGHGSPDRLAGQLESLGVSSSRYEGPTTICSLISQRIGELGGETITLIVSLPQYTQLDDDFIGTLRLESILSSLYNLPLPEDGIQKAQQQRDQINDAVESNPQVKEIVEHLERSFDGRAENFDEEEPPPLSPEVEDFLREMERRFRRE